MECATISELTAEVKRLTNQTPSDRISASPPEKLPTTQEESHEKNKVRRRSLLRHSTSHGQLPPRGATPTGRRGMSPYGTGSMRTSLSVGSQLVTMQTRLDWLDERIGSLEAKGRSPHNSESAYSSDGHAPEVTNGRNRTSRIGRKGGTGSGEIVDLSMMEEEMKKANEFVLMRQDFLQVMVSRVFDSHSVDALYCACVCPYLQPKSTQPPIYENKTFVEHVNRTIDRPQTNLKLNVEFVQLMIASAKQLRESCSVS